MSSVARVSWWPGPGSRLTRGRATVKGRLRGRNISLDAWDSEGNSAIAEWL